MRLIFALLRHVDIDGNFDMLHQMKTSGKYNPHRASFLACRAGDLDFESDILSRLPREPRDLVGQSHHPDLLGTAFFWITGFFFTAGWATLRWRGVAGLSWTLMTLDPLLVL